MAPRTFGAFCGGLRVLLFTLLGAPAAWGGQPQAPDVAAPAAPAWVFTAVDHSRLESWSFFEPQPAGGDPRYTFLGNRLRLELQRRWRSIEVTGAAQHVGLLGLPADAAGPGALYFNQGGRRTAPQALYLRYLNVRLGDLLRGVDLQSGRLPYASGAEAPSGVPKIESVKRQRLDARLVGEFEWSLFQRGYDGVRLDFTRPRWKATGVALKPTQGGFARAAGQTMADILVAGATFSTRPLPGPGRRTQWQGFGLHYADHREVTDRPDNTGRTAPAVDIAVTTLGGVLVGAYPTRSGEFDMFGWVAVQRGDWYGQDHAAFAVAGEAGYQWTRTRWQPWVRAGVVQASGDEDGSDRRHETFFPMLPTARRYSQTTAYTSMNLRDLFVQVMARPRQPLAVRFDLHRLDLASAPDLWYAGSGATLARGGAFGYAGRRSNGSTRLGTSFELSADYAVTRRWSINAFLSHMAGGPVVTGTFAGRRLWFAYLENVIRIDHRR
jgi:hypothetical protein